jgi:hypothetical protein
VSGPVTTTHSTLSTINISTLSLQSAITLSIG